MSLDALVHSEQVALVESEGRRSRQHLYVGARLDGPGEFMRGLVAEAIRICPQVVAQASAQGGLVVYEHDPYAGFRRGESGGHPGGTTTHDGHLSMLVAVAVDGAGGRIHVDGPQACDPAYHGADGLPQQPGSV